MDADSTAAHERRKCGAAVTTFNVSIFFFIFVVVLHLNLFDHFYGFMDESAMGGIIEGSKGCVNIITAVLVHFLE
jgi:hypothetical protein